MQVVNLKRWQKGYILEQWCENCEIHQNHPKIKTIRLHLQSLILWIVGGAECPHCQQTQPPQRRTHTQV